MNMMWKGTEALADGMTKILREHGIVSGSLLDLCCGNGRVCVHMAKNGFKSTGVDISRAYGNLSTLQPVTPFAGMDLVAVALAE